MNYKRSEETKQMMKAAVTTFKEGLCFICSEEAEDEINTAECEYVCVPCHKNCWDQACCSLVKFPECRISDKRFQKLTGIDISYVCYVCSDGTKEWLLNGKLHREDGPAIERADGSKEWFLDSNRHREGGPAVEHMDGTKAWFLDGKFHREDGPAWEGADGSKSWYLNDRPLSKQDHADAMKRRRQ